MTRNTALIADDEEAPRAQLRAALTQAWPDEVETILQAGNQRFLSGEPIKRDHTRLIDATATGQFPIAAVLGCIDSRAPAELLFDLGLGDIFSARVAGNIATTELMGSLEFACAVAGAKLVVVLGHTSCGAVKGACDNVQMGNLTGLLALSTLALAGFVLFVGWADRFDDDAKSLLLGPLSGALALLLSALAGALLANRVLSWREAPARARDQDSEGARPSGRFTPPAQKDSGESGGDGKADVEAA